MDEIRRIFPELYAQDDQARRDFADWEAERAQRAKSEKGEQSKEPALQPRQQPTMTPEQQAPWDVWCERIARNEVYKLCEIVADEVGAMIGELSRKQDDSQAALESRIAALESTVANLEARIAELKHANGDGTRSNLVPMLTLKGGPSCCITMNSSTT